MTTLSIYSVPRSGEAEVVTSDPKEIARHLGAQGIRFEQWDAALELPPGAGQDAILAAYGPEIKRLNAEGGYQSADVVRLTPDHPDRAAMRTKFLDEHTHSEDEVRFFVEGSGAFYLHLGDRVHQVVCERGDLLGVPAGTRHWFDMGPAPFFTAIRLFTNPDGWAANFTGDKIAATLPRFGE